MSYLELVPESSTVFDDDGTQIPISIFMRVEQAQPSKAYTHTWSVLAGHFSDFSRTENFERKQDAPLFSPTIFSDNHRHAISATTAGMVVLDSDNDYQIPALADFMSESRIEGLIYSSARHRNDSPKWRLMVPLTAPIRATEYKGVASAIVRVIASNAPAGWKIDTSKLTAESLFYIPGQYKRATDDDGTEYTPDHVFEHIHGDVLTGQEWCELADRINPTPVVEPPPPRALTPRPVRAANDDENTAVWEYGRDAQHIADRYLSMSSDRHRALSGICVSIAMSALNAGYDISASELSDIATDLQRQNRPSKAYTAKELDNLADDALGKAKQNVGDEPAYKKKQEAKNRKSNYQQSEYERFLRDVEDMDKEVTSDKCGFESKGDAAAAERDNPFTETVDEDMSAEIPQEKRKSRFRSRLEDKLAPPPKMLVAGLIPENSDAAIYAPVQFLKSFVALDIMYAVATGINALGTFPVLQTGPCIYYCGEGYDDVIKYRSTAWEMAHGFEPYSVENVIFANEAPYINDPVGLKNDITDLKQWLDGREAKLIVIDTLNRALNGEDEDRAHTASKYFRVAKEMRKELGGTTLTIGHMGKDVTKGGRGSNAFYGGYDTEIHIIEHVHDTLTDVHTICVKLQKQKAGRGGMTYWLQSRLEGTPEGGDSLVLFPVSATEAQTAIKDVRQSNHSKVVKLTLAEHVESVLFGMTDGGYVSTDRLIKALVERTGRTHEGLKTSLKTGAKDGGDLQKFKVETGKWSLPEIIAAENMENGNTTEHDTNVVFH